jgi:hypothetical protein
VDLLKRKVAHSLDIQELVEYYSHITILQMHNLKTNFDKFLAITKEFLALDLNPMDNVQYYPRPPSMSDAEIISLSICSESIGIDSENYLWSKLQSDYMASFPNLPHRTNYNRRRKRLATYIHKLTEYIARQLPTVGAYYVVDSMPVPVCRIARERRCKICKESYETAPDKGFTPSLQKWYYGYKLQMITTVDGIYRGMELTKASVHDIHYLDEIIGQKTISDGVLIADRGYLSAPKQLELFEQNHIRLFTPMRRGQRNYKTFPSLFKWKRKRIETLFAQMCDQMMLKRNYAKSFNGIRTRIICKVASVTCLQWMNHKNDKPHTKYQNRHGSY